LNSKQEEILETLSQKSLGGPFIFAPDEYKKGNATREPADLVWACNNCIILFFMKSKVDETYKENNVIKGRKDKLITENFKQAKGWLNEWKEGRNLIGKNKFRKFNINYTEYKHIIVLGIIDYGNEEGFYHFNYEKDLGVKLCATLSQKTFEFLVSIDVTAVDLILLILSLRERTQADNSVQLLSIGLDYYTNAHKYAYSSAQNLLPTVLPEQDLLNSINKIFRAFRSALLLKINSEDNVANNCASIFNDIPLKDYYQLVIILSQRVKFHAEDPRRMIVYLQELEKYIFCIGVADIRNFHLMGPKQLEIEKKLMESKLTKTLVGIGFDTLYSTFILSIKPRIEKSHLETILDSI
jgi:hypothetical protein